MWERSTSEFTTKKVKKASGISMNNFCLRLDNGKREKEIDNGGTLARRQDCKHENISRCI